MYFKKGREEALGRVPASFPGHRAPGRWAIPPCAAHRAGPREGLGGCLTYVCLGFFEYWLYLYGLKKL